jgi:hypothetical protein
LVLLDDSRRIVASVLKAKNLIGSFLVENPELWWPYLSKNEDKYAYLYTLEVFSSARYEIIVVEFIHFCRCK